MFLIYGANGYAGSMIAEEAVRRGLKPILAGRNEQEIKALGHRLQLPIRIFPCQKNEIIKNIEDVDLVLHCAGPFSATSKPMLQACLETQTHYLDISGEIRVFERVLSQSAEFRKAGIVGIPGVGFDVVPSDGLAALLKEELPDADHLTLALKISGVPSRGSLKTFLEGLHAGGVVRENGNLKMVPPLFKTRKISFSSGEELVVLAPWADVSSAYYSTGIPNIETYISIHPRIVNLIQLSRYIQPLLRLRSVQEGLKKIVDLTLVGPTSSAREKQTFEIWGEVSNSKGEKRTGIIRTPNGYDVTVDAALSATQKVLAGSVPPGSYAPSSAFGSDFIFSLKGVSRVT